MGLDKLIINALLMIVKSGSFTANTDYMFKVVAVMKQAQDYLNAPDQSAGQQRLQPEQEDAKDEDAKDD